MPRTPPPLTPEQLVRMLEAEARQKELGQAPPMSPPQPMSQPAPEPQPQNFEPSDELEIERPQQRYLRIIQRASEVSEDHPMYDVAQENIKRARRKLQKELSSQRSYDTSRNEEEQKEALDAGPAATFANEALMGIPGMFGAEGSAETSRKQNPVSSMAGTAAGIVLPMGVGAGGALARRAAVGAAKKAAESEGRKLALRQAANAALGPKGATGPLIGPDDLQAILRFARPAGRTALTRPLPGGMGIPGAMSGAAGIAQLLRQGQ